MRKRSGIECLRFAPAFGVDSELTKNDLLKGIILKLNMMEAPAEISELVEKPKALAKKPAVQKKAKVT